MSKIFLDELFRHEIEKTSTKNKLTNTIKQMLQLSGANKENSAESSSFIEKKPYELQDVSESSSIENISIT